MSLGRTPLFRKLTQAIRQAHWLNRNPDKQQLFLELRDARKVSRRDFVRLIGGGPKALRGLGKIALQRLDDADRGAFHLRNKRGHGSVAELEPEGPVMRRDGPSRRVAVQSNRSPLCWKLTFST